MRSARLDFSGRKSEMVTSVTVRAARATLGEREDLDGQHLEHEGRLSQRSPMFILVVEGAVAHQELKSSVPLGGPCLALSTSSV
jgi:hypothetical protein